jgi:putative hemolysin
MSLYLLGHAALSCIAIVLSALFSGIETGCYTLNRIGLAVRVGRRERAARILDGEIGRPDRLLATILVGNNIANYLSGLGIAAILDHFGFGPFESVALNLVVLLPITFLFAETLPKDLFRTYTDAWTYLFASYIRAWRVALTIIPLVPLVSLIGGGVRRWVGGSDAAALVGPRQRIAKLIREGVHAGVLSEGQTTLADRALALREFTVSGEMTPWHRVAFVPLEATPAARASIIGRSGASRLPVVDRAGRVVGVLTALDAILDPTRSTADIMSAAKVFAPTDTALAALRAMRADRVRLAIVSDPGSQLPLGVVAIKDLVEPVTGSIGSS